jgi:hypothetical protein
MYTWRAPCAGAHYGDAASKAEEDIMRTRTQSIFVLVLLFTCILVFDTAAQTGSKCDDADKECSKSEASGDEVSTPVADKNLSQNTGSKPDLRSAVLNKITTPTKVDLATSKQTEPEQQAAGDDQQELAKKLANPVSSLISLPLQNNFDFGMGANKDGFRYTLNIQPVIPIKINENWNVISRTILPIIGQDNVVGDSAQFGLGDTVQSFFFSPNKSEPFVWGLGPQVLIPTATSEYLGSQKLGLGVTGLILKQKSGWSVGALVNHMWSVAGKDTRADVSLTYIQPFVSYTNKTAWTFTLNTETTYDWAAKAWGVPIHAQVSKLVKIGKRPASVGGGLRCWAASAPGGPHWCGLRLIITPLFPPK